MLKMKINAILISLSLSAQCLSIAQETPGTDLTSGHPLLFLYFAGSELASGFNETDVLTKHLGSEAGKNLLRDINASLAAHLNPSILAMQEKLGANPWTQGEVESMLADLQIHEFMIRWDNGDAPSKRMSMAVNLDALSMERWLDALGNMASPDKLNGVETFHVAGFSGSEIREQSMRLAWIQAGSWLLIGHVDSGSSQLAKMVNSIKTTGRPFPLPENGILSFQMNGNPFNKNSANSELQVKGVHMTLSGTGSSLRTEMDIRLTEDPDIEISDWDIPRELIQDPLICFTAGRGLFGLLQSMGWIHLNLPNEVKDQVHAWAQYNTIGASGQVVFPSNRAGEVVQYLASKWLNKINARVETLPLAPVQYSERNNALYWQNLPVFTPVLSASKDDRFLHGAYFPPVNSGEPPPDELFQQFKDREDLIYYHWELTGERGGQWQRTFQLLSLFSIKPTFSLKTPAQKFVQELFADLPDTATEITLGSENNLVLVRRSKSFFTSLELVTLGLWIDQGHFPHKKPRLPFEPLRTKAALIQKAK